MVESINGRKLKREMLDAIESDSRASSVHRDSTTYRYCSSDRFDGIEYRFYGAYIPIRPIIEVVRNTDGVRIEHLAHVTDEYEPNLTVFVAELPQVTKNRAFIG